VWLQVGIIFKAWGPGQPSVPVEPPADPTLSSAAAISDVSAPKAPAGRGSALVQLLARKYNSF